MRYDEEKNKSRSIAGREKTLAKRQNGPHSRRLSRRCLRCCDFHHPSPGATVSADPSFSAGAFVADTAVPDPAVADTALPDPAVASAAVGTSVANNAATAAATVYTAGGDTQVEDALSSEVDELEVGPRGDGVFLAGENSGDSPNDDMTPETPPAAVNEAGDVQRTAFTVSLINMKT